jgi:hypothetical protein
MRRPALQVHCSRLTAAGRRIKVLGSSIKRSFHLLQWLWALPLTACGLPLWCAAGLLGRTGQSEQQQAVLSRQATGWVFIAHGPLFAALLKRHPFGHMHAVAVGCCVFASDAASLAEHLTHELVHVRQARQWGVLFPVAYAASSAWQRLHGRCAYADNWFERQANRA